MIKRIIFYLLLVNSSILYSQTYSWNYLGSRNNNGTNGTIYAIVQYNGRIIVGGDFTTAGGLNVNNIAEWNGAGWSSLGSGINGEVHCLTLYNGELIAGGEFTTAGGVPVNNISKWNGVQWTVLSSGLNGSVDALSQYENDLYAGGSFNHSGTLNLNKIARWNGVNWSDVGNGVTGNSSKISCFTVFNSLLITGGKFTAAGGVPTVNIAAWDGISWIPMSSNTDERISALTVFQNNLYAGGKFTSIGNISANHLAKWNGIIWSEAGSGVDNDVNDLTTFNGNLIAAGSFRFAGSGANQIYASRIASFNGSTWSRMLTGMNAKVNALASISNQELYAGGEFSSAGGKWCYTISKWSALPTVTVSGEIRYSDNNEPVGRGKVKVLRMDVESREIILLDSVSFTNGVYQLPRVPRDSCLRVIVFPDDELLNPINPDFVPVYYPSTIYWTEAGLINPINNLNNIDIHVIRSLPLYSSNSLSLSGYAHLNIFPYNIFLEGFPYKSGTIIYAKQGNNYYGYSVSDDFEQYSINGLNAGDYEITAVRLGYEEETKSILLSQSNDTLNFYLDTLNGPIISTGNGSEIAGDFQLYQNFPNPFNPLTEIQFNISRNSYVMLKVFDVTGREVKTLLNDYLNTGKYKIKFNGNDLPSGLYFYRMNTGQYTITRKMVLIK